MPFLANVQMTVSAAPGTGYFQLAAAAAGAQSFAAAGGVDGTVYGYRAEEGASWEIGLGTYAASAGRLIRTTVLFSSASSNAAVSFGAGVIVSQVLTPGEVQAALGFTPVQSGGGAGMQANALKLGWDGSSPRLQVDNSDVGPLWCDANALGSVGPDASSNIQRFPSGLIFYAVSSVVTTDSNGFGSIALPSTSTVACYAMAINGDYQTTGIPIASVGSFTTSGFKIYVPNGGGVTLRVNWIAWGRWK